MDRWRIIVVNGRREVLVAARGGLSAFPELGVPENARPVPHLRRGLELGWDLESACLRPIDLGASALEDAEPRYYLAELTRPRALPPGELRWAAASVLTRESFRDGCDFEALADALARPALDGSGPFGRPGAFREIAEWVERAARREGFALNGRFEQHQASSRFSLVRFDAAPRALWFKAVGEPNEREFHLTRAAALYCPRYVPRILASRPEWNAWLAEECAGSTLAETGDAGLWHEGARGLAQLQIASLPHAPTFLARGAHRWESFFLPPSLDRFLEVARKAGGEDGARSRLELFRAGIPETAGRLGTLRIPAALGHLDMNSGNVIASRERCAFLDWAEAYVGFPFATFAYLLEGFRSAFGRESPDQASLVETYLKPWRAVLPSGAVSEAWALAPVLALYAYTARCMAGAEPRYTLVPQVRSYLRALLGRLERDLRSRDAVEVRS